ncbi:MAG: hypothetical protein WCI12_09255 [Actinomycetes bacterium]
MSPSVGLPERPQPDPVVLALVATAAQQMLTPMLAAEAPVGPQNEWRFSGRWFASHPLSRRQRPF